MFYMDKEADLKARAIKTVEDAEKSPNKSRWDYATWQMKVNLIYDMRYGGSGDGISGGLEKLTGGLWDAEKSKENAVVAVLSSSRSDGEFRKIVDQYGAYEYNTKEAYGMGMVKCEEHDKIIDYLRQHGAKRGKEQGSR